MPRSLRYQTSPLLLLLLRTLLLGSMALLPHTAMAQQSTAAPTKTLTQTLLQRGDTTFWAGLAGANPHEVPTGIDDECGTSWFFDCGFGMRIGIEQHRPHDKAPMQTLKRYTMDFYEYDDFSFLSLFVSRGIGVAFTANRYIGVGADVSLSAGLTRVRVFNDTAYTPIVDLDVSISMHLSRLVMALGVNYRQVVDTQVDGHSYSPALRGGYFSLGLSF